MSQIVLEKNKHYDEAEIINLIKQSSPTSSDTHAKWVLFEMQKSKKITRIGQRRYIAGEGNKYDPDLQSIIVSRITDEINRFFPLIKYVIWETIQLNEWANLLIARNIIIIEIESGFESIIFDKLLDSFGDSYTLLFNPNEEMISRYMRDGLIVVKSLYSRSPLNRNNHKIMLEKLIVDVLAEDFLGNMLGSKGIGLLIKEIKRVYTVNESKMLTYARRRNRELELRYYWGPIK